MSDFTGDFASAKAMSWQQFISARAHAKIAAEVGLIGREHSMTADQVARIGFRAQRDDRLFVTLRIVPNDERILLFANDGAVVWLRRPAGTRALGYFLVTLIVGPGVDALFLASFRGPGRMPEVRRGQSQRVWHSRTVWIGPRSADRDPEGEYARFRVAMLGSLLSTGFLLLEGATDPRDVMLPSVSVSTEIAVAAADRAEPPLTLASAFASARMPAKVVPAVPFVVDVGFDGPEATEHDGWERVLVEGLDPDELVTAKVLRVHNVEVEPGTPDSFDFPVPTGETTQLTTFALRALAPGRVEVHLRFRQTGITVGLLRLVADATGHPVAGRAKAQDKRPFQIRPRRDCVLEISVGTSADGNRLGMEFDLALDGMKHNWTRSVLTDYVLSPLYQDIETEWKAAVSAHPDSPWVRDEAFAAEVRRLGATLFQSFVPEGLQQLMRENAERFRGLTLVTNEPRIPWEIACIDVGKGEGLLWAELGLVRGLSGVVPKSHVRIDPSRTKFLFPDYPDTFDQLQSASAEQAFLAEQLHATPIAPSSVPAVKSFLATRDYDLFHFAGHGSPDESDRGNQSILLMGRRGPVPFSSRALETALRRAEASDSDSGRVVMLNACHSGALWSDTSGFAVAFLRGGVDVFVGSQWSVADDSAAFFASALYLALLGGATIHDATTQAREASRADGGVGWMAYAVYGDPDASIEFDPVGI